MFYVRQIMRKLVTRINKHRRDNKKSNNPYTITMHKLQFDHEFDWNEEILVLFYKGHLIRGLHLTRKRSERFPSDFDELLICCSSGQNRETFIFIRTQSHV